MVMKFCPNCGAFLHTTAWGVLSSKGLRGCAKCITILEKPSYYIRGRGMPDIVDNYENKIKPEFLERLRRRHKEMEIEK